MILNLPQYGTHNVILLIYLYGSKYMTMMLVGNVIIRYTIFIISVIIEDKLNFLINSITDNIILQLPCIFVFFTIICLLVYSFVFFFYYPVQCFVDFNKSSFKKKFYILNESDGPKVPWGMPHNYFPHESRLPSYSLSFRLLSNDCR